MPQRPEAPVIFSSPAAQLVFSTLLRVGPASRVEVVRRTGLSSAAVTKAVRPLLEAGYLVECLEDAPERGIGRPAAPLAVRGDRAFFVGIKITATELIGTVTDLCAKALVSKHEPLTSPSVEHVVSMIGKLTGELLGASPDYRARCRHLALSIAGDVDPATGMVGFSPFLDWHAVPLAQLATQATRLETVVENDVRALTVAEQWFGGGVDAHSFVLVTVGAGIGCGIVVNDAVIAGAHGVSGELGHLPIQPDGPVCHCGNIGCVEAVASDDAIVAAIHAKYHTRLDPAAALHMARAGDPVARAAYRRAGHAIGLALASVANLIGPERILISGEGLAGYDLFEEQLRDSFAAHAFGAAANCQLSVRPLPFEEWARGAAVVAIRDLITAESK
ncbi:MAG TPA: ROK family transcriptional regulator [Pseudonocardiaceae bacterium]|jgi:predicted NBD/HSP70 family sugar kinase